MTDIMNELTIRTTGLIMHPVHRQLFSERFSKSPGRMFKNYFLVICGSAFKYGDLQLTGICWNINTYGLTN
jgi:hypothetical protein